MSGFDPKALAALKAANQAKGVDQTETQTGGNFVRETPEQGPVMLRLVSYVELGQHAEDFQGQKKTPNKVFIEFELRGQKYPVENSETGRTKPFTIGFVITLSNSDRAKYHAIFNRMRDGREDVKHMLDMLGEAFIGRVYHNVKNGGTQQEVIYANLNNKADGYSIKPPFRTEEDPETGTMKKTRLNVPEAITPFKVFLWDFADQGQWDSIFIDGQSKPKTDDAGNVVEEGRSRNWLQDTIKKALNFKGSPIYAVLQGAGSLGLDEPERPSRSGKTDEEALMDSFGGGDDHDQDSGYDLNDDIPF